MNSYELSFHAQNELVLGLDEAGRGPLAGPLVVSGVILKPDTSHPEINDSKKISEKKRNLLYQWILDNAYWTKILVIDEKTIDNQNIYQATKQAMKQIAQQASARIILSDAMPFEIEGKEVISIIKGIKRALVLRAASILSKVTRDRIMIDLDQKYPQYGFARHKGYPTKAHYEALKKYGPIDCHRQSFKLFKD